MSEEIKGPKGQHKPAMSADTLGDLKTMAATSRKAQDTGESERLRRAEAFGHYANYQSEYYKRTNKERVDKANTPGRQKVKVDSFGDGKVTLIAQIKINPETGKVENGHDYNPEAQSRHEIEAAWNHYLETTSLDQRLVIYEGPPMDEQFFGSLESAIKDSGRGDSGELQYLARQGDVPAVSGEADNRIQAELFKKDGVPNEEAILFFTLRSMAAAYSDEPVPEDLAMNFHFQLAELGTPGFGVFSDEQKQHLRNNPEALAAEKAKVLPYVEKWNETLRNSGMTELVLGKDGNLRFNKSLTNNEVGKSIDAGGDTRLAELGRLNIKGRDRHIFETIATATKDGKKPFVVYGGSHVVSLEPVLQSYYGSMQSS